MPPRKLSSFGLKPNEYEAMFEPTTPEHRPEHARRIAKAFATSALTDTEIVRIFANLLGDAAHPASAIYSRLRSAGAKKDAITAVAETVLPPEDAERLLAIQNLIAKAASDRNRFAHWGWGFSEQLPAYILFQDPVVRRQHDLRAVEATVAAMGGDTQQMARWLSGHFWDPDGIWAYSTADIDDAVDRMVRARHLLMLFCVTIGPHAQTSQLQRQLLDDAPDL